MSDDILDVFFRGYGCGLMLVIRLIGVALGLITFFVLAACALAPLALVVFAGRYFLQMVGFIQ